VLIVDDETPVLDVARSYLEEIGIDVLTADNANEALQLVEQHGNSIEVMILDYLMPDKTGLELLDKIAPKIDVDCYLTSGFSRGEISDPDIRCRLTGFIAKPFSREELQGLFRADHTQ
jgi:CheY-like chemotaxis protein